MRLGIRAMAVGGALFVVLLLGLAAMRLTERPAGATGHRTFIIGGIDANAGPTVPVHGRTFDFVAGQLASTETQEKTRIQLTFAGPQAFDLTNAEVTTRRDKWSITLRGVSTNFIGVTGSQPVQVIVLFDWTSANTDDNPSLVVSGIARGFTVGSALNLPADHSLADAGLDAVAFTTGESPTSDTEDLQHIARTSNLPPEMVAFLETIYGADDVPSPVPALSDLNGQLFISASMGTDFLPGAAKDVLSLPNGGKAVLEGGVGIKFGATFKPEEGAWSLRGTLPRASASMPESFPDFLTFEPSARWSAAIAGKDGIVSLSASADMTTQLLGAEQSVFVEATVKRNRTTPSAGTVGLYALLGGDWFSPLGITWLEIDQLLVQGEFGRVVPQGSTVPKTVFTGGLNGVATVAGKRMTVLTSGKLLGNDLNASIELRMDDSLSAGSLLAAVGIDTATLPGSVTSATIDHPGIRIEVVNGTNPTPPPANRRSITMSVAAGGHFELPNGFRLGVDYLFSVDSTGKLLLGVRAGKTTLKVNDILPTALEAPIDLTLATETGSSSFGFVFAGEPITDRINNLPVLVREFYRPLFGRVSTDTSDFAVSVPRGGSVLGSFELPKELAGILASVGAQSRVTASGTLPIFATDVAVDLRLTVAVQSKELLPDFVESIAGSLVMDVDGTPPRVRFGLDGQLALRFRSGLPADAAGPLNSAGIPVAVDAPVTSSSVCPSGRPQEVTDGNLYCFDSLLVKGKWVIDVEPSTATAKVTVAGSLTTPSGIWHPFGLEWLGIQDLVLELSVAAKANGVEVEVGLLGDVVLAGKDRLTAINLAVTAIPAPPFIEKVELKGIRMASGAGIAISDLFDLQHEIAKVAARNLNRPEPARFDMAAFDIPNFALRNYQLSFSPVPAGVPTLCIPGGLILSGDVYVNPTGNEPVGNPDCKDGSLLIPSVKDQCLERRKDGCLAMGRFGVSAEGILGLAQIPGLDIGPIHLSDANMDVAVTVGDQHLVIAGGAEIDDVLSGELKVDMKPGTMNIFGEVNAFTFQALVDVSGNLSLLTNPDPSFNLHVLLATSKRQIAEPSFSSFANRVLAAPMVPLRTTAVLANGILSDIEGGGTPLTTMMQLPTRLQTAGVPVPEDLSRFNAEAGAFLASFDGALRQLGGDTLDVVLNGFPGFRIEGERGTRVQVCVFYNPFTWECVEEIDECVGVVVGGECWIVPPVEFPGTPGVCAIAFPSDRYPALRGADGKCGLDGMVRAVVLPIFDSAIRSALGFEVDTRALIRVIAAAAADPKEMLGLDCAEYTLGVGPAKVNSSLKVAARVLGQPVGFEVAFNFAEPDKSVKALLESLIRQLLNPGSVACAGLNEDLFQGDVPKPGDQPPAALRLSVVAPGSVDEGSALTLKGSYGGTLGAARTVQITWGDGTTHVAEVAAGQTGFEVDHTYADDSPSATSADLAMITAKDLTDGRSVASAVTVRNVAPTLISFAAASKVVEGGATAFRVTFSDPGTADTHRVLVDWGDGARVAAEVTSGQTELTMTHTFTDDNPTGTPSDDYLVRVRLLDDDGGQVSIAYPFSVMNSEPGNVRIEAIGTAVEAGPAVLRISWDDAGAADSHTVVVDWGEGDRPAITRAAPGQRSVVLSNTYGDNGTFPVGVKVLDDDTGAADFASTVTVTNLAPVIRLERAGTYATAGGDTFVRRVGVPLEARAKTTDRGSDDLRFTWSWGDGATEDSVDRVNPPADDPLPSPTLQPRSVTAVRAHTYARPCLYRLDVGVADDDGATRGDGAPVVVTGDTVAVRQHGWWGEEYRHYERMGSSAQFDQETLRCFLAIARHMSPVLGEALPLETAGDAAAVLHPDTARGSDLDKRRRTFDRALLTLWLNVASGATGADGGGAIDPQFAAAVNAAERVRLDPNASARDVLSAERSLENAEHRFRRQR